MFAQDPSAPPHAWCRHDLDGAVSIAVFVILNTVLQQHPLRLGHRDRVRDRVLPRAHRCRLLMYFRRGALQERAQLRPRRARLPVVGGIMMLGTSSATASTRPGNSPTPKPERLGSAWGRRSRSALLGLILGVVLMGSSGSFNPTFFRRKREAADRGRRRCRYELRRSFSATTGRPPRTAHSPQASSRAGSGRRSWSSSATTSTAARRVETGSYRGRSTRSAEHAIGRAVADSRRPVSR